MMTCKKHLAATLAGVGALAYAVCHFWVYAVPADLMGLHQDLLRMSVLGWSGMNVQSFVLGLIEWAVWGALLGLAISTIGAWCAKGCSKMK